MKNKIFKKLTLRSPPTLCACILAGFMAAAAAAKYRHFDVTVVDGGVAIVTYDRADNKVRRKGYIRRKERKKKTLIPFYC